MTHVEFDDSQLIVQIQGWQRTLALNRTIATTLTNAAIAKPGRIELKNDCFAGIVADRE